MHDLVLRASTFVNPRTFEVERSRAVCIAQGRIVEIADYDARLNAKRNIALERATILPAFVNAHAHLDLSHLKGEELDGSDFGRWLVAVVKGRSAPVAQVAQAAGEAAVAMVASGTSRVIDILAQHAATLDVAKAIAATPIGGVLACEIFDGLGATTPEAAVAELRQRERKVADVVAGSRLRAGLSPHAPYTVSQRLYHWIADRADHDGMLQTTHLAEAPMEREYLAHGSGQLRNLFENFGADYSSFHASGLTPLDYWMQAVGEHGRDTLLVHCYDMREDEIARIGAFHAGVAYCPRSRAYFGHPPFKLEAFLAAGCNVCLGTDSRASNDSLNLFDELARMREEQPQADATTLFAIATVNGRKALERGARMHNADVAAWADFNIVEWGSNTPTLASLIEARPQTLLTVIDGEIVYRASP